MRAKLPARVNVCRKLSITGNVFGVHLAKSGTCYVSVVTEKGDRLIQAFDRNGSLLKSFPAQVTKAGKPFEPYQVFKNCFVDEQLNDELVG